MRSKRVAWAPLVAACAISVAYILVFGVDWGFTFRSGTLPSIRSGYAFTPEVFRDESKLQQWSTFVRDLSAAQDFTIRNGDFRTGSVHCSSDSRSSRSGRKDTVLESCRNGASIMNKPESLQSWQYAGSRCTTLGAFALSSYATARSVASPCPSTCRPLAPCKWRRYRHYESHNGDSTAILWGTGMSFIPRFVPAT